MKTAKSKIRHYDLWTGGKIHPAFGKGTFASYNPSTGEVLAQLANAQIEDVRSAILSAHRAYEEGSWKNMTAAERGIYLKRIAKIIRDNAKELAELESLDVGKTLKQTTFIDVPTCADTFDFFSNVGHWLEPRQNIVDAPIDSVTEREPYGVVSCIIPWNYPLIMAGWKIAPALIAGNAVILKPSPLASVSLSALAEFIKDIGLPPGILNIVTTNEVSAARELVQHPKVGMVSFSGGTQTGKAVLKDSAETLKKSVLELGGKSAAIVFGDCDLEATIGGVMSSIFMNQGQMCTACSRLFIEDSIYEKFVKQLVEKTKALKIGLAQEATTDFGPVISAEHRDNILAFVEEAKNSGAKIVCGGKAVSGRGGFYIEPTILVDVKNEMNVAREEIFGPILCVMSFRTEEEAVRQANDSSFGLAACIWTKNMDRGKKISRELTAGTVWINTYGGFYNEVSFGGCKGSGFGRELGLEGLLEFTQSKHICIDKTPGGRPLVASWF